MLGVVWGAAAIGIAIKLSFQAVSTGLPLSSIWRSAGAAWWSCGPWLTRLPATTLWLIAAGGIVYSAGVMFFAWHRLRFQAAVWHAFVVIAAGLHLAAVMDCLVINRL